MNTLPQPTPEQRAHSAEVLAVIRDEIAAQDGWISFARYMELALYAPSLGYYSAGLQKFGADGDFVTAPEISPLFGQTLARQVAQILLSCGGDVLELGAGTGKLAVQMLAELQRLGAVPEHYYILEVSAHLRRVQQEITWRELPHDLAVRVEWLDTLPAEFTGCVIGNEVLDALPVHVVATTSTKKDILIERGIAIENGALVWRERPASQRLTAHFATHSLPPGMVTEVCPAAAALVASLAFRLRRGAMLFVDYGFPRREYYHPQRDGGTLMCHYRHHAHDDPLLFPGLQDITAHVDFSAIAEAATACGMRVAGYATQAQFLINAGITEILSRVSPDDLDAYLPRAAEAQKLLSPAEMGELFKVIVLAKEMDEQLIGFTRGDKSHTL
ncbi:MAG: SAM-dependent methyltransferase [Methylobacillus sp.]|jgi:SAM-dependent MidA family methyltransferase|nr:SAM-dependent methyltransferase [Methylobacillus sp.]